MSKIIDVIRKYDPYENYHFYLVLDEMPNFVYEKSSDGRTLIAEQDGFAELYQFESPTRYAQAFGGREFELKLKDGTIEKCKGQWWWGCPKGCIDVGINTIKGLEDCYVFAGGHVKQEILNEWLKNNTPKTDYYFYEKLRRFP